MLKILDLCAGTRSVKKAFPECDYKGIDIYSPEGKNILLDLTQEDIVKKLLEKLGDWKPDFIWASPVCNKFSMSTTGKNGNTYFVVEGDDIRLRKPEEYIDVKHNGYNKKPENWNRYYEEGKQALVLHKSIVKIINYFNVPFVIENPAYALTRYVYKQYVRNVCDYCEYGFDYKKPTAIYSNIELNLKRCNKNRPHEHLKFDRISSKNWPTHWNRDISIYANRSSVPPKLIKTIISRAVGK